MVSPGRLYALNAIRWIRHHAVAWTLLFVIYSLTAAVLMETIVSELISGGWSFPLIWAATAGAVLLPGALELLSFRVAPNRGPARWVGAIGGRNAVAPVYVTHEIRRGGYWIGIALMAAAALVCVAQSPPLWILAAQITSQRALFSISHWRRLAAGYRPESGAYELIGAFTLSQGLQMAVALGLILPFAVLRGDASPALALKIASAGFGTVLAAGSVVFEGDSGRAWLVNFMSLAAGLLGAVTSWATPLALPVLYYFNRRMAASVANRLKSVENPDEDFVIP